MSECGYARKLSAYHDDELSGEDRRELEGHLRGCPNCARELEQVRKLSGLIRTAPIPVIPSRTLAELHARLGSVNGKGVIRMAKLLAAAALILFLIGSAAFWRIGIDTAFNADFAQEWEDAAAAGWVDAPSTEEPEVQLARSFFMDSARENGNE